MSLVLSVSDSEETRGDLLLLQGPPVRDILVVIGGWGSAKEGEALEAGPRTGTSQLIQKLDGIEPLPEHKIKRLSVEGELTVNTIGDSSRPNHIVVPKVVEFIRSELHPLGRLIIYGYSAGGYTALEVVREIQSTLKYYSLTRRRFYGKPSESTIGEVLGWVRVDLLVTVDASTGPLSSIMDRKVPSCVARNLNFFQTTPAKKVRSHGGPATAQNPALTVIENFDLTATATHDMIDNMTIQQVCDAISAALGQRVSSTSLGGVKGRSAKSAELHGAHLQRVGTSRVFWRQPGKIGW